MDFSENRHTWDLFSHVDILPIMIYYVYILCIYIYMCDMHVKSQEIVHLNYGVFILSTQTVYSYWNMLYVC